MLLNFHIPLKIVLLASFMDLERKCNQVFYPLMSYFFKFYNPLNMVLSTDESQNITDNFRSYFIHVSIL